MQIYVEDISEDYGTHGVTVYSLVHGMDFYYAEVRASGITLFDNSGFDDGIKMDKEHPMTGQLREAVNKELTKEK